MTKTLAFAAALAVAATAAHAGPVSYSAAGVFNPQTVTLDAPTLGVHEAAAAGRIDLSTPVGILSTFCIDVAHNLLPSGTFADGGTLGGELGATVNALVSHAGPTLATDPNASAALQVAIWKAEYGSTLNVGAPEAVAALAANYAGQVATGAWRADPAVQVAVLAGNGANQDQARLVPVPEPASLAVLGAGLAAFGMARRRDPARRGQVLDITA